MIQIAESISPSERGIADMKSFQQFMKENEAQDDKMDTAIQDVENKKNAQLKKKKEEEENEETAKRLERIANLESEVENIKKGMS